MIDDVGQNQPSIENWSLLFNMLDDLPRPLHALELHNLLLQDLLALHEEDLGKITLVECGIHTVEPLICEPFHRQNSIIRQEEK